MKVLKSLQLSCCAGIYRLMRLSLHLWSHVRVRIKVGYCLVLKSLFGLHVEFDVFSRNYLRQIEINEQVRLHVYYKLQPKVVAKSH